MTPLFSLVLIVILAYIGSVFFQRTSSNSLLMKGISHSGLHYLILGFILGPNIFGVINSKILNELSLILSFVLGWTGFLIGLQINFKQMKRFQVNYYWIALGVFILIFVLIFSGAYEIQFVFNIDLDIFQLLILAVAASISSPLIIGIIKKEYKLRGKYIHFLQFQSAYDNMVGIIIMGLIISVINYNAIGFSKTILDLIVSITISIILAFLFYFVTKEIKNFQQYFLVIIGFLLLVVGSALQLKQSSVFIAFLFGFVLANLPINTWKLFQTISNTEKPIYLLLLIFIGASIININIFIVATGIVFTLWRIASKYLVGILTIFSIDENKIMRKSAGIMGIGMGGLSLALILDYQMLNNSPNIEILTGIIITTFLITDGMSFIITNPIIKRKKA